MANKTAGLQKDVVNNVEDLQFFLRDLNQWENQIKKKDFELRQQTISSESNPVMPKVRNSSEESKTQMVENISEKPDKQKKNVRIASSDYKSWDKFDVDSACNQVENESSSSDEDDEIHLNWRRQEAILQKDKGNEYLKVGKIPEALESYTKGCDLDPENALIPANRALAFLKSQQYGAAEQDCDTAISLDSTYVKAYQRRAAACEALGKCEKAIKDLEYVLKCEPRNKEARNKLEKLKKSFKKSDKAEISVSQLESAVDEEIILAIDKPEHLRSKKPLQRILVTDLKENQIDSKLSPKVPKLDKIKIDLSESKSSINIAKHVPKLPNSPSSFFRFQTDFTQLKSYPELQYQYLKNIPSKQYLSLFCDSLEPNILSDIIQILQDFYVRNGDDAYEPLRQLVMTKRFNTLKLFLSQKDKDNLDQIFNYLSKHGSFEEFDVKDLIDAYGL